MKGRFFLTSFSYHKGCALNRRNAFLFWSVGTEIFKRQAVGCVQRFSSDAYKCSWFTFTKKKNRNEMEKRICFAGSILKIHFIFLAVIFRNIFLVAFRLGFSVY